MLGSHSNELRHTQSQEQTAVYQCMHAVFAYSVLVLAARAQPMNWLTEVRRPLMGNSSQLI